MSKQCYKVPLNDKVREVNGVYSYKFATSLATMGTNMPFNTYNRAPIKKPSQIINCTGIAHET